MAQVIAGLASSHAYTFLQPEDWDERRLVTRGRYAARYGAQPPDVPGMADETLEGNQQRFERIRDGLTLLRLKFEALKPDTLVLIGDDQDENYREDNLPQFAVFTGETFRRAGRGAAEGAPYTCDTELASAILEGCVEAGFDLASSKRFPDDALISHAHVEILRFLDPEGRVPVVPIFVNAIHVPGPTPRRCYQFGEELRRIIEASGGGKRVALYASGGLSHYTAGFPWAHYRGDATVGSIDVDFDQRTVDCIARGEGAELAKLSSRDLLDSGNIELRQWIVLMGALGNQKPAYLAYEPFFRGVMGMATGYWELAS